MATTLHAEISRAMSAFHLTERGLCALLGDSESRVHKIIAGKAAGRLSRKEREGLMILTGKSTSELRELIHANRSHGSNVKGPSTFGIGRIKVPLGAAISCCTNSPDDENENDLDKKDKKEMLLKKFINVFGGLARDQQEVIRRFHFQHQPENVIARELDRPLRAVILLRQEGLQELRRQMTM